MAEANATPPAAPAIDYEKLAAALKPQIDAAVSAATQPLAEQIGKLQPAPAAEQKGTDAGKPQPLTREDLKAFFAEQQAAQQKTDQAKAARDAYIAQHFAGDKQVPSGFLDRIPATTNAAELAAAEQQVRNAWAAEQAKFGIKPPTISGTPPANGAPATTAPKDWGKMNGAELLREGMKQQQPAGVQPTAADLAAEKVTRTIA